MVHPLTKDVADATSMCMIVLIRPNIAAVKIGTIAEVGADSGVEENANEFEVIEVHDWSKTLSDEDFRRLLADVDALSQAQLAALDAAIKARGG